MREGWIDVSACAAWELDHDHQQPGIYRNKRCEFRRFRIECATCQCGDTGNVVAIGQHHSLCRTHGGRIVIRLSGLTFKYRGDGFQLDIPELEIPTGRITALLGPNGSGKSTLLHLLSGVLRPTQGTIVFCGHPHQKAIMHREVGVLSQAFPPTSRLSARRWLQLAATLRSAASPVPEAHLDPDLLEVADRRFDQLSRGQSRRIGLALAQLGAGPYLLLDEPAEALDPMALVSFRSAVLQARGAGKTVLIASHLLSEVERVADCVVFMREGRIVRQIDRKTSNASDEQTQLVVVGVGEHELGRALEDPAVQAYRRDESGRLRVVIRGRGESCSALLRQILETGGIIESLKPLADDLEEIFREVVTEEESHA